VSTPGGSIVASDVVVATNAWISRLLPDVRVQPMRAQMLAARVEPAPAWPTPVYANRGADYWRRLDDGTVLLGGQRAVGGAGEEGDDARPAAPVQPALDALLVRLLHLGFPEAACAALAQRKIIGATLRRGGRIIVEVTDRWAGTMGFTADAMPIVGEAPGRPRVWVLGGFHGHGMGWGPGLAVRLAAAIASGAAVSPEFSPSRPSLSGPARR
jgi:glycine/D-amino acid oxidase-like deaminating enzyme